MRRQPSLRSQLNQIRLWVRQGRTDAWIAHKLDVSIDQLSRFKREQDLEPDSSASARPASPSSVPSPAADDDELADLEAPASGGAGEPARDVAAGAEPHEASEPEPITAEQDDPDDAEDEEEEDEVDVDEDDSGVQAPAHGDSDPVLDESAGPGSPEEADAAPKRRRGRRGGRRRRSGRPDSFEATFDHGDEGYGLWLDPAVTDSSVYSEHWAGHRAVTVTLSAETITIRRAGESEGGSEE